MSDELRARFEAWISLPPFEHSCTRNGETSAWPGTYRLYATEISWEAWQACHAAMQGEDAARDVELLPVEIHGKWIDVPILVQLHIIGLRDKIAHMTADETCVGVYDAVMRSGITRDVKTKETKTLVVLKAIDAAMGERHG